MKERIMPALTLTIICIITAALLVAAYAFTYVDNTGIITDKLSAGLAEIYGSAEGFEMLTDEDGAVKKYDGVTSVIADKNGNVSFEITANGYNKGGLHLLIGFDGSGTICGISVLTMGETPGVGTKVQDGGFLSRFKGLSPDDGTADIDTITGATYSSKGVKNAAQTALDAYARLKGENEDG